ncbi:SUMO-interacting motif-containing protein 1 isoform X3 [Pogoniulus pusillus]|uniref:SUMO-interacting motif-containing protein 1 isoform X3 n=1 Tax=Pogoniulus pusillus TaxID=488313 RepID=UPI0030B98DEE
MSDSGALMNASDSESRHSPPSPLRRRCCFCCRRDHHRRCQMPARRQLPPPAEIIDLTYEDTSTVPQSRFTIIDLTEDTHSPPYTTSVADQDPRQAPLSPAAHMFHPQLCSTPAQEMETVTRPYPATPRHSTPAEPSATVDRAESCSPSTFSYRGSCSPEENCSTTTFNSDLGSLASKQLDSDMLPLSPSSLDSSSRASDSEEDAPHTCQQSELPLKLSPASAIPTKAQGPLLEAGDLHTHEVIQQVTPTRTEADNKAWLNKLQYFRSSGVQHLFLQGVAPNRQTHQQKPELIPSGKLNMVRTTMEENFLEGTLHFLNDFVSCQHYPPKEIVSHLIRRILLNPRRKEMLKDTYMLLMKIQMEVVEWLVAAVTGIGFSQPQEQPQETAYSPPEAKAKHSSSAPQQTTAHAEVSSAFFTQKVMLLLQRMLSIAVEVDKSPNCSSCKIADVMFPFILNIPLRSQREAFLNTMESQLLRCKLLEQLFQHSCDLPTTLPLSLAKILYFLNHFSVLLPYQDETATWQRWDEMLQYLNLLLMSYQNVILDRLGSSLNDRMDLIIQKVKPRLQADDDINHLEVQLKTDNFISRMQQLLGQPLPLQITEKLHLLQELFLIVAAM